jgi:glycine/D-amino acid oxidase-like deaminating enzyme
MRVLVVGAGVIGTAVAWELLQRGAEVVLLEGSAEGGHTSDRLRRDGEPVQPHARRHPCPAPLLAEPADVP